MECPECGKLIEVRISNYPDKVDYIEVETACEDKHIYFSRVHGDDLIKAD